MTKIQALMSGACMVVLALGPGVVHAQTYPETTAEACSDRVDNDGDGYIDCYDSDCRGFAYCAQAEQAPPQGYQAPPQGYQPPPQGYPPPQQGYPPQGYQPGYQVQPGYQQQPPAGYQQQPPAGYYVRPTYVVRPPPTGVPDVIVGFIMLGFGIAGAGGSYPLWQTALSGSTFFSSSTKTAYLIGAIVLDIFATAMVIVGVILVPSGFGKIARHKKWKSQQSPNAPVSLFQYKGLGITPTLGLAPAYAGTSTDGATVGVKITF